MYITTQPADHYTCICSFLQPKDIALLELICKQFSNFQKKYVSYFDQVKDIKQQFKDHKDDLVINSKYEFPGEIKLEFRERIEKKFYGALKSDSLVWRLDHITEPLGGDIIYKNFRFLNIECIEMIDHIMLEVGGITTQKIHNRQFKVLRHLYNIKDNLAIPLFLNKPLQPKTCYNDIIIFIKLKIGVQEENLKDIGFSVNSYILDTDFHNQQVFNSNEKRTLNLMYQTTRWETGIVLNKKFEIKLSNISRFIITHILLCVPNNKVKELNINFGKFSIPKNASRGPIISRFRRIGRTLYVDPQKIEQYDNFYIIPLTKSFDYDTIVDYGVNSMGDNVLHVELEHLPKGQPYYAFGINVNFTVTLSGVCGALFNYF